MLNFSQFAKDQAASLLSSDQKAAFKQSSAVKKVVVVERAHWGKVSPTEYSSVYKALPRVTQDSPLGALFADGRADHHTPLVSRKSMEVLPGIYSFGADLLRFQREFSIEANAAMKPELDADMFSTNGLHTTFDRLRSPAGYLQTPMSYKTVDNKEIRKELGLTPGYSPRQRAIAEEVWTLVWSEAIAAPVNIPKMSAGGMRRFSKDTQWKMAFAQWIMEPANCERMLTAVESGDWLTLANDFETVYGMNTQKRIQLDDVGKERLANNIEYALSGGRKGRRVPTDKTVVIDNVKYLDFAALRVRVIDAGPWAVNCFLQVVATAAMQSIFERWSDVFHVNTAAEISALIEGKHIYASDVKEYDQSMSADAVDVPFSTMREKYDPRVATAARRLMEAPYFARPLELDGKVGQWILDPRDWSQKINSGNRSGHAFTSLIAKVNKVIESMFIVDKLYPLLGHCKRFLEGGFPIRLINNGDDEIVIFDTAVDKKSFLVVRADLSAGHYVVTPEVGQGFSGLLMVRTGPTSYKPSPRVQTPLEKIWIPERSIGGRMRQFWPIGINVRIEALMATDLGRQAWDINMSCYNRILRPTHGPLMDLIARGMADIELPYAALTEADKEVIIDPAKLHYKYRLSEITPSVLDAISAKIPASIAEHFLRRYYTGVLK